MSRDDIESLNTLILLCLNFLQLLRSAQILKALSVAQRNFRTEVRRKLDEIEANKK